MGNFIWGRVYGLGKIGRGKVYDSLQEYSPLMWRAMYGLSLPRGCPLRFGLVLKRECINPKKLDVKTWLLSGPNRTHQSCYPT